MKRELFLTVCHSPSECYIKYQGYTVLQAFVFPLIRNRIREPAASASCIELLMRRVKVYEDN